MHIWPCLFRELSPMSTYHNAALFLWAALLLHCGFFLLYFMCSWTVLTQNGSQRCVNHSSKGAAKVPEAPCRRQRMEFKTSRSSGTGRSMSYTSLGRLDGVWKNLWPEYIRTSGSVVARTFPKESCITNLLMLIHLALSLLKLHTELKGWVPPPPTTTTPPF